MNFVKSLKEINLSNHHRHFSNIFKLLDRRITANPRWMSDVDSSDLSKTVLDLDNRIIMQPGEVFACDVVRRTPPRVGYKSPMIILGTPYGTLAAHYPNQLASGLEQSMFSNLDLCNVHMTPSFLEATKRYLQREPKIAMDLDAGKNARWKCATLDKKMVISFIKFWMLTEDFFAQINEQAEVDRANGLEVNDSMPVPQPIVRAEKPDRRANKPSAAKPANSDRRNKKQPDRRNVKSTVLTSHMLSVEANRKKAQTDKARSPVKAVNDDSMTLAAQSPM